ncbi:MULTISPECIES: type VII secretion integral membrane protein EccD [unclassified Streptomyces]|uniref:type VII secretion integral membrane protein EccD n=1 Tax=unclassified Streptomyces TaxID=2593676 RepID=UPI0022B62A65|nr:MULTISPECIES: type VII secretion integral membrane protein EccD [unclassified Streptomyces]MCZ7413894.1 type VII secretion integral membrane protein EccD [Streptomyces sp. WMMC897]MCZ7430890.1 type VII secretion integral membrane protein EccD [Streptomyces sp. WMMC1477]
MNTAPAFAPAGAEAPTGTAPRPAEGTAAERRPGHDFCRIALAGPRSRADLAVPFGVPLARLLPALVQHAGEETGPDGGLAHGGWILRRADGTRLDAERPLSAQRVREGDLLFLAHGTEDTTGPLYDDVVEVIAGSGAGASWSTGKVRGAAAAFGTAAALGAAAALVATPGTLAGVLALVLAALTLGTAALVSRAFADAAAGTWTAALAAPFAAVGAALLLGEGFGAAQLLLVCAVVAVLGAGGPLLVGAGDGTFAALVTAGVLTAPGALVALVWSTGPARAATVATALALAVTPLLPPLALRLAHIPGPRLVTDAEELEELPEPMGHALLERRVAKARRLLSGLLAGAFLVVGGGALLLLASGELWPSVLAGTLGLLALLRARLFTAAPQARAALAAGLAVLCGAVAVTVSRFPQEAVPLLAVVLPGCALVALVACAVGVFSGRRGLNPRVARTLDGFETLLLLSVVPLVLAVWDVYTALLELRA